MIPAAALPRFSFAARMTGAWGRAPIETGGAEALKRYQTIPLAGPAEGPGEGDRPRVPEENPSVA